MSETLTFAIDGAVVNGWPAFHEAFARMPGWPSYYGRNKDAWWDCIRNLDEEPDWRLPPGGVVHVKVSNGAQLADHSPDIVDFLLKYVAAANASLADDAAAPPYRLVLSGDFSGHEPDAAGLKPGESDLALQPQPERPEPPMSPHDFRAEAIARQRGMGEDEIVMIKTGLEDIRAGRTIPHDELMARVAAKHGW